MKQMNGLPLLSGGMGYNFYRPGDPERVALFVRCRLLGFSPEWAAFWAFVHRPAEGIAFNHRIVDHFERTGSYKDKGCQLLPPGFMDMLESV
jgi:hypothetical protein